MTVMKLALFLALLSMSLTACGGLASGERAETPAATATAREAEHESVVPETDPPAEVPTQASGPCAAITLTDPRHASLLAFARERVTGAGTRIGRALCIARVEPAHDVEGAEERVAMDLEVRDEASGETLPFRLWARPIGRSGGWEEPFFERRVVEDFSLLAVPAWLATRPALRMIWREEVQSETWLTALTVGREGTLCHENRRGRTCWAEPGPPVNVRAWDFTYEEPLDLEESPSGVLELALADGAIVRDAFRSAGDTRRFERAHGALLPTHATTIDRAPEWAPRQRPARAPSRDATPALVHRAVTARATADLGPFAFLRVTPVGDGSVLFTRTMLSARVCARLATGWMCTPPTTTDDGGHRYAENRVIDGLVLGPSTVAVVRSTREIERGPEGRGLLTLEILDVMDGTLVRRGALPIGAASWVRETSAGQSVRRMTRRLVHRVRAESEGCVRIEEPDNFVGPVDLGFVPLAEGVPLQLARAGAELPFTPDSPPAVDVAVDDLAGYWQLTASGLSRVAACANGPSVRLVAPTLPTALSEDAHTCLADLAGELEARGPLPRIDPTGPGATRPCGAVIHGFHDAPSRMRLVHDGDRLARSIESYTLGASVYRSVYEELYRGAAHVGQTHVSTQYEDGVAECVNTRRATYTLDARGRPLQERAVVASCEGVDSGLFLARYTWARRADHDEAWVTRRHESDARGARVLRTYVPSHAAPEAMVEREEGEAVGTCWLDVRDERGLLRERLFGGEQRWEYAYACEGPEWPPLEID